MTVSSARPVPTPPGDPLSHTTQARQANRRHAAQLLDEARPLLARRQALLAASVALGDTASVPAALDALRSWPGPEEVRAAAIAIVQGLRHAAGTP